MKIPYFEQRKIQLTIRSFVSVAVGIITLIVFASNSYSGLLDVFKDEKQIMYDNISDNEYNNVESLLKSGFDVNTIIDGSVTPLDVALGGFNYSIIKLLLNNDAKPDLANCSIHTLVGGIESGNSDLINEDTDMVSENAVEISGLLINSGANVNCQKDLDGDTALHKLARGYANNIKEKVLGYLLTSGADPMLKNSDGLTALDISREYSEDSEANKILTHRLERASMVSQNFTRTRRTR